MRVLYLVLFLLVVWAVFQSSREMFEPTASIKAPPYDAVEKKRIFDMAQTAHQQRLLAKAKAANPTETNDEKLKELAGELLVPAITSFFVTLFKPATVPLTNEDVRTFMTNRVSDISDIEEDVVRTYFIEQSGIGDSSEYAKLLGEVGQNAGYLVSNAAPVTGTSAGTTTTASTGATTTTGGTAGSTTPGATTGATTGTTPGTTPGTTAGLGAAGRNVFGPAFMGMDETKALSRSSTDSSKTTQYPQLLGGGESKPSVGTGSSSGAMNDAGLKWGFPSAGSLGATENSKFLPYSRVPGDMDIIPDPYRVSQSFSTSSYSSKTEPVPFLTDFSAFLR